MSHQDLTAKIIDLHPTQMTVGMREVETRRSHWKEKNEKEREKFLQDHRIPVVIGPKKLQYISDHHHLLLGLHQDAVPEVPISIQQDLSALKVREFWNFLDTKSLMHPFDRYGRRCPYDHLPNLISGLLDDPYRTIVWEVRRQGGFDKDPTPFSEFLWADFYRWRLAEHLIESDFAKASAQALALAKTPAAAHLPGWCGVAEKKS